MIADDFSKPRVDGENAPLTKPHTPEVAVTTIRNEERVSPGISKPKAIALHETVPSITAEVPVMSTEQGRVLELVKSGQSVFYTGCAGTGKSFLLRKIIEELRKDHATKPDAVAVTASTGIAACNIGGVTLHSFAGIGVGNDTVESLILRVRKNSKASLRWKRTDVLIIDEISMVDGNLFDKLSVIAQSIRNKSEVFGGLQVVITGDFFQLPPVTIKRAPTFAFDSRVWKDSVQHVFNLKHVFRQSDKEFIDILAEMRVGKLESVSAHKLKSLSRAVTYTDGLEATELYSHRSDVDRANNARLRKLKTECQLYRAEDGGSIRDQYQRDRMLDGFLAVRDLVLKVDAQVMVIKNIDEQLVNGRIGQVVGFRPMNDEEIIARNFATFEDAVAYPIVRFKSQEVFQDVLISPEIFKVELPSGEILVSRIQVPLVLAWAMSIHKSQGLTLDRVKVDLGKVFERGQSYVALSRATSMDKLQILNFNSSKVRAHPKVIEWSKQLELLE